MKNIKTSFADYNFSLSSREEEFAIASFDPNAIASAIETLGWRYAFANEQQERAKHEAEKIFSHLVQEHRKIAGSVSGAEAMAKTHPDYQDALTVVRAKERERIKAQSSFKAAEAYSKMTITKVSSEAKIGEYYKKNTVT